MNITALYIYPSFWTVAIVRQYPHALFVFGDNDCGKGTGGQAIIRNEPNSIGLPTKKMPRNTKHSFYTDEEYADNCLKIDIAIQSILKVALQKKYTTIVLPANGFGTGLSQLQNKAPHTLAYIEQKIECLKGFFPIVHELL